MALNILLIEDNPIDSRIISKLLIGKPENPIHLTTSNLLSKGISHLEQGNVDAVFLDLVLPDSNGIETFIHVQSRFATIPIIVLTGYNDEELALQAIRLGAQDYLVKGQINRNILNRSLSFAIERKKAQEKVIEHFKTLITKHNIAELEQQDNTYEDIIYENSTEETDKHLPNNTPIAIQKAIEEFDNDEDFFFEVLEEFLQTVEKQIEQLHQALADNKADIVKKEAHAIKGGAANITAMPLSQAAKILEEIGKQGDLTNAHQSLDTLEKEFIALCNFSKRKPDRY
ncbi:MAG: response regulator [Desulfobacterales bacterium]|nr:response regulator [Desulfobacterales bacterium]